jgi:hypothetical protein
MLNIDELQHLARWLSQTVNMILPNHRIEMGYRLDYSVCLKGQLAKGFIMALHQEELPCATMELAPTWKMAVRVWWAITWRGFLLSMIPVFLLTLPVSIVFMVLERSVGLNPSITNGMSQGVGMLIGFCVQVYVIKTILNKDFPDFRIMVTTRLEDNSDTESQAEQQHTSAA